MANPYFQNAYSDSNQKEYDLYNNSSLEIIEIYGRQFQYLKKTLVKPDYVFGEDTIKQFNDSKSITLLIENFEEYSGQGDIFSKFGLSIDDRLTLISQKQHFLDVVGTEPQNGDLIYYPTSNRIFKVNHIKYDDSFNQFLGSSMTYKLECVLLKYSHEELNTGINNVDDLENETSSTTSDEITQLNNKATEIIDFDDDFFSNN